MKECPSGLKLSENNDKIVDCILELKAQYAEMCLLLKKQEEERVKLQAEMDRIAYKLLMVKKRALKKLNTKKIFFQLNKSIVQRTKNIQIYEKTIAEAEARYGELVRTSNFLVKALQDNAEFLDANTGNKKVGPDVKQQEPHITHEQREDLKKYIEENIIQRAELTATFLIHTSTKI